MKRKFFHYLTIPILPFILNPFLVSCAQKNYYTFDVKTNFGDDTATLSNRKAILYTNFETIISFKKSFNLKEIVISTGDKNLINNVDYSYTYSSNNIDLFIKGESINQNILTINLHLNEFLVNFKATNNKALISNNIVTYKQDFNTTIKIDEGQNFESIVVESSSRRFIEETDYKLTVLPETNTIELSVFASSIIEISLSITVTLSKASFQVKVLSSDIYITLSNEYALVDENYSTLIWITNKSYFFDSISIFNGNTTLKINEDFFIEFFDDHAFLQVKGKSIIQNTLSIDIKLIHTNYKLIPISLLNLIQQWQPDIHQNVLILSGLLKGEEINAYDCLKIPDSVYEIQKNAFLSEFNWNQKKNVNIQSIVFSHLSKLTKIDDAAFKECTALSSSITLPDSLVYIGDEAFSKCQFSGNLTIPKSIEYIGKNAFSQCNFSDTLIFKKNNNKSLPHINEGAFYGCNKIKQIDLTEYDTFVPDWAKSDIGAKNIFNLLPENGVVYVRNNPSLDWSGLKTCCALPSSWTIMEL